MKTALALLAALLMAAPALAGTVFEIDIREGTSPDAPTSSGALSLDANQLKIEGDLAGRKGQAKALLFHADRNEVVIVDHTDKSFLRLDEAGIKELGNQISGALKQMEESLKTLSPDQRALAEGLLKQQLPQAQAEEKMPVPEVLKTSNHDTVNDIPCTIYEIYIEKEKVHEMCVAEWNRMPGGGDAKVMVGKLGGFFERAMGSLRGSLGRLAGGFDLSKAPFAAWSKLDGFPVRTRELKNGQVEREITLRQAESRTFTPADFEIPQGYRERALHQP